MIKLDQVYKEALAKEDTKDSTLIKFNVAQKCKLQLIRENYIIYCIRCSICPFCGAEGLTKQLCTVCNLKSGAENRLLENK